MIVFIPANEWSTDANSASSVNELDISYVKLTESKQTSFRIGNTGTETVSNVLSLIDELDPNVNDTASLSLDELELAPGATSNTITLTVAPPLDATAGSHIITVSSSSGETLDVFAVYVGPNTERASQIPREGQATRITSAVISSLGDQLDLFVFHPVAFDPTDTRRLMNDMVITFPPGQGQYEADPCSRLSPSHELEQAYTQTTERIIANFGSENRTFRQTYQATNSTITYEVTASLTLPAEFPLTREWALFSPESRDGLTPSLYKRSVYLIKRGGEWFDIANERTIDFGADHSHYACDLIAIRDRKMGDPSYYCPFSLVWGLHSDQPFACFTCPCDIPLLAADGSGSNPSQSS